MADYLEEELKIMEERSSDKNSTISAGVDINDPIKTLSLVPIVTAQDSTSLAEVIKIMNTVSIGCILLKDDTGAISGIFTERDLLCKVAVGEIDLKAVAVKDYMTKDPETLSSEDPIAFALNKMSDGSYRHIPVTKAGEVKYMLSVKDIVDQIAFTYRKSVLNLPPNPKQTTTEYGG